MNHGKQLLSAWRALDTSKKSLILPGDEEIREYGDVLTSSEFAKKDQVVIPNRKFFLNLIPQPFAGKLLTAKVYVLLLNPGFGNLDLFAEEQSPEFRNKLIKTLGGQCPHLGFDPSLHWTGGFQWTTRKFRTLIEKVQNDRSWSMHKTLSFFAEHVATVELVPYHSAHYHLSPKVVDRLKSVNLVRKFVVEDLARRAADGDCTIIVTRKAREWGIRNGPNILVYPPSESRSAHLSINTRGGKAILKQLEKIN
jgi:hypothetical protein